MSRRVTIQASGRTFTVKEGESVLDGALREGVVIAYGCRNGACGSCKGRVLSGSVDHGAFEEHVLCAPEREAGLALFCRARPRTDLVVDCREIAAAGDVPVRQLPCRVQSVERVAPEVMRIKLKLPSNERLQFLAGQYIDILWKEGGRRSLSMANPPHDDELVELHLRNYGGPFSRYVFGRMKEKDMLRLEGPLGTFFLREGGMKPVVFVAGGTGFAPIKAMIEHAIHVRIARPMTLYWGCRTRADLYLNDLAERWNAGHGLRYVPVLSEPLPADEWTGRTDFVHRAVMQDLPDLSEYQAYVCGSPAMVEAARRDFTTQCGLPEEEFYSDAFTPAAGISPGSPG